MTTFKVGDQARKINSNVGDWLSDGELVTITAVHDNRSVSVANGRANLVVDVSHLQPEPAPTADPQPTAGEGSPDDPLIAEYGDGYAAGYADGLKEHDRLQADNARLADELAQARALLDVAKDTLKACTKVLELGVLPSTEPFLSKFVSVADFEKSKAVWDTVNAADKQVEVFYTLLSKQVSK